MNEPENLILRKMQEMREEIAARDEKLQAQVGTLAQGINSIRTELKELRTEIGSVKQHIHELAIAIDHHTTRLDGIERHLGLDAAKH